MCQVFLNTTTNRRMLQTRISSLNRLQKTCIVLMQIFINFLRISMGNLMQNIQVMVYTWIQKKGVTKYGILTQAGIFINEFKFLWRSNAEGREIQSNKGLNLFMNQSVILFLCTFLCSSAVCTNAAEP